VLPKSTTSEKPDERPLHRSFPLTLSVIRGRVKKMRMVRIKEQKATPEIPSKREGEVS
jgi:hypothetical protein